MGKFENKSVIVTGGALGIGAATCEAFAREGAMVTIMDINEESGKELQEKILGQRGISSYFYADAGRAIDCKNTVDFASKTYGGVDIVFNNVGIQPPNSYLNAVDLPEEMWDRILDVNLKSRFLMAKYSIPEMRKRGGGVLIHSASVQGLQSMEGVSAYAATKGGDLSLVRQLSLDFAKENIRVLAVNPGAIDTPMVRNAITGTGGDLESELIKTAKAHPIGRIGQGKDIAEAVLFLASDEASFITGSYLNVDGGMMAVGAWGDTVGSDGSN